MSAVSATDTVLVSGPYDEHPPSILESDLAMPLDPVTLAAQLNVLLAFAASSLTKFPGRMLPATFKQAASSLITTAQNYLASPQWVALIAFLNNPRP
jgi:hypothetical protein